MDSSLFISINRLYHHCISSLIQPLRVIQFYVNFPIFYFSIHFTNIHYSLIYSRLYKLYSEYHTLFLILGLKLFSYSLSLHAKSPLYISRFFLTIVINSFLLILLNKTTLYLITCSHVRRHLYIVRPLILTSF